MKQASRFDGLSFDPFSLFQNSLAPRRQLALVVAAMVVIDEGVGLLSEITGQVVVFQEDAVLQGLVPSIARQAIAKQSAERGSILPWVCG